MGRILASQFTPLTPVPLLPMAVAMPVTWVPWSTKPKPKLTPTKPASKSKKEKKGVGKRPRRVAALTHIASLQRFLRFYGYSCSINYTEDEEGSALRYKDDLPQVFSLLHAPLGFSSFL